LSAQIRAHLRGNVIGYVALFVAFSGSAIALPGSNSIDGNDLRRNVVKSKNIRTHAVKSGDLADNSVLSAKVLDEALGANDLGPDSVNSDEIVTNAVDSPEIAANAVGTGEIAANAVDSGEIANDAVGSTEIANDAVGSTEIAAGSVGQSEIGSGAVHSDELAGANFVLGPAVNAPNGALTNATLDCPAGRKLLSGGALTGFTGDLFDMVNNHPNTSNQWRVGYRNDSGATRTFNLVIFCANV
jgi:hypothetical protein